MSHAGHLAMGTELSISAPEPRCYHRMAEMGHKDQFPPPRLNGWCRFSQETFGWPSGNGRGAPIPDLPSPPGTGRFDPRAVSRCFARINSGVLRVLTLPQNPVGF